MENTREDELVENETPVDNGQVENEEIETSENEVEETDVVEEESESPNDNVEAESKTTKDDATEEELAKRAHYAELKRQKKAQEKANKESTQNDIKVNEFTGLPIEDDADLKEYQDMLNAKANGIDPTNIREYSKFRKEQKKQAEINSRLAALEAENRAMKEKAKQEEWFANDGKLFNEKYPNVDIIELGKNADFAEYAEGKVGNTPLIKIYEGFKAMQDKHQAQIEDEKNKALARAKSSPGSFNNTEDVTTAVDAYSEYKRLLRLAKQGKI